MQRLPRLLIVSLLATCVIGAAALAAAPAEPAGVIVVPPGNRSTTQPEISTSSIVRTNETQSDFATKFRAVYDALAADKPLIQKIVKTAGIYNIDPIHMIGAIVGEHTYNVDVFDNLQGYYVKALAYLHTGSLRFAYNDEPIAKFVVRPQFAECAAGKTDYDTWACRDHVWRDVFQGKTVGGEAFPDDRFERVFFQPFYVGQTFGLGQLSPLTALMVSDIVAARSGLPPLDMSDAPRVYQSVMDPDATFQYMAAIIRHDIDAYRAIAGFDISKNPGLTATLYNTGQTSERAAKLAAENLKRRAAGSAVQFPRENYYGWLINDRLTELEKLLPQSPGSGSNSKPGPAG